MTTTIDTSAQRTAVPGIGEVDRAVRAVLAGMLGNGARRNGRPKVGADAAVPVFSGRLLSLKQAETLAGGARVVQVAPGTVVTPLARDHLKRHGVEIRFAARAEVERLRNTGEWGFAITLESGLITAVRRALLDAPEGWQELGESLEEAVGWVAEAGASSEAEGRGALVLTDEASVAVYRACRVPGVRAAAAVEPHAVARAVRALGVNVLVVEPAGLSIALIRQLATTFRRAGGPVCPEWLI
jgi:hypothetical protein